mgnify:CR=1 FL=1
MLHGIVSNLNSTFIVTKQWNMFHIDPIIFKSLVIQSNWAQHEPTTMYSTSVVDNDTEFCFLEDQDTRDLPRNRQVPKVDFLSTLSLATQSKEDLLGYQMPKFGVWIKYLTILFTALRWHTLGAAWYHAHMHTLSIISGREAHRYNNEPIMER